MRQFILGAIACYVGSDLWYKIKREHQRREIDKAFESFYRTQVTDTSRLEAAADHYKQMVGPVGKEVW